MQKIGMATWLALRCENYRQFQIDSIQEWLEVPIELDQIKFFYDYFGSPVGFVVWAYLAPEVAYRLVNDSNFEMHISEWNEGNELWIIDFVAPFSHAYEIARGMQKKFINENKVEYIKVYKNNKVRKISIKLPPAKPEVYCWGASKALVKQELPKGG
jgi:cytolysin-activating lysine-acyltransferase